MKYLGINVHVNGDNIMSLNSHAAQTFFGTLKQVFSFGVRWNVTTVLLTVIYARGSDIRIQNSASTKVAASLQIYSEKQDMVGLIY